MSELTVRAIGRDELDAFATLHAEQGKVVPPAVLEWEYFDPDLTRQGIVVGAYDGDALIGTQAYIPYRAWWMERAVLSCKSESTLLSPSYRGRKVFDRMYTLGFELCREAGVDCIWGFTSAEKPFAKIGFDITGELFQEIVSWSPVRLYRSVRHGAGGARHPRPWDRAPTPIARSKHGEFGLERDLPYLRHRYVNNPVRDIAYVDDETGALFSYGGRLAFLLRVSEVVDRTQLAGAVRRCKARVGKDFLGVERFSNHPVFGWGTIPGSAYVRRTSPLRIVWKWLGSLEGTPTPEFEVDEGYTEGIN